MEEGDEEEDTTNMDVAMPLPTTSSFEASSSSGSSSSSVEINTSGGGRQNAHLAVMHDKLSAKYSKAEQHHKRDYHRMSTILVPTGKTAHSHYLTKTHHDTYDRDLGHEGISLGGASISSSETIGSTYSFNTTSSISVCNMKQAFCNTAGCDICGGNNICPHGRRKGLCTQEECVTRQRKAENVAQRARSRKYLTPEMDSTYF